MFCKLCSAFLEQGSVESDWAVGGTQACRFNPRRQANVLSFELTTVQHGRRDVTSLYDIGEFQNEWAINCADWEQDEYELCND